MRTDTEAKATQEVEDLLEAFQKHSETLELRHLFRAFRVLRIKTLAGVIGGLITALSISAAMGYQVSEFMRSLRKDTQAERKVDGNRKINISKVSYAASSSALWLTAITHFLEEEGRAETASDPQKQSINALIETSEFASPNSPLLAEVKTVSQLQVTGFAFVAQHHEKNVLYLPVPADADGSSLRITAPPSAIISSLVILVRVSGSPDLLPKSLEDLRRSLSLEIGS